MGVGTEVEAFPLIRTRASWSSISSTLDCFSVKSKSCMWFSREGSGTSSASPPRGIIGKGISRAVSIATTGFSAGEIATEIGGSVELAQMICPLMAKRRNKRFNIAVTPCLIIRACTNEGTNARTSSRLVTFQK